MRTLSARVGLRLCRATALGSAAQKQRKIPAIGRGAYQFFTGKVK
jgi:hypothetical protein